MKWLLTPPKAPPFQPRRSLSRCGLRSGGVFLSGREASRAFALKAARSGTLARAASARPCRQNSIKATPRAKTSPPTKT